MDQLWRPAAHEEQGRQLQRNSDRHHHRHQEQQSVVSIPLTGGAELAEFKERWQQPLFSGCGYRPVELRRKSGEPFSLLAANTAAASAPAPAPAPGGRSRTRSGDGGAGLSSASKLDGLSSPGLPIVLKSMGVIQAEKRRRAVSMMMNKASCEMESKAKLAETATKKIKPRAVSMDETSLNRLHELHYTRNKTSCDTKKVAAPPALPLPLPLPPPPGDPARNQYYDHEQRIRRRHPRHLSIDLRASSAAKFVVQVMPWEISSCSSSSSSSSSSLDLLDDSTCSSLSASRRSIGNHCFVPFKWEEAPGKPKQSSITTTSAATIHGSGDGGGGIVDHGGASGGGDSGASKLQLPPRLQQHHQRSVSMPRSSPTSTLDRGAVDKENSSSSSASSPRIDAASRSNSFTFPGDSAIGGGGSGSGSDQTPRWIRSLLALHTALRAVSRSRSNNDREEEDQDQDFCDERKKKILSRSLYPPRKNRSASESSRSVPYPSWSPAPVSRSSWLFHHRLVHSSGGGGGTRDWAFRKMAWRSCNAVKRAVRFRWWPPSLPSSLSRPRGFAGSKKKTKTNRSMYTPLLCPLDGDSSAFGCSATTAAPKRKFKSYLSHRI